MDGVLDVVALVAERVAWDVREGWVSVPRAQTVYKVVLDEEAKVDALATAALRGAP